MLGVHFGTFHVQLNLPTILRKSLWHAAASDCLSLSLEKIELLCSKMPEDLIWNQYLFQCSEIFFKKGFVPPSLQREYYAVGTKKKFPDKSISHLENLSG